MMMGSGAVGEWTNFVVAAAGASAALAGLVFVALSINLSRIIELPGVASRAAETIGHLAAALAASLAVLVPHLSGVQLGILLLTIGLPVWAAPTMTQIGEMRRGQYHRRRHALWRFVSHQISTLPLLVGAAGVICEWANALYWYAASVALIILVALLNAWVLLVEIVR